jgi:hypothetical protein
LSNQWGSAAPPPPPLANQWGSAAPPPPTPPRGPLAPPPPPPPDQLVDHARWADFSVSWSATDVVLCSRIGGIWLSLVFDVNFIVTNL